MRLGILIESVSPESGGAFTVSDYLIKELLSTHVFAQYEVYIFGPEKMKKNFISRNWKFVAFSTNKLIKHWIYFQLKSLLLKRRWARIRLGEFSLNYLLSKSKIELLWSPTPIRYSLYVPYINTVWDLGHLEVPYLPEFSNLDNDEFAFRENKMSLIIRRAAANVVGTNFLKQKIIDTYRISEKRVTVAGIPSHQILNQTPPQKSAKSFLYPAQFWAHKNHVTLLKAIAILRNEYFLNVSLRLVGSDRGSLKTVRYWIKNLGLCESVTIYDYVTSEELASLYRDSFALIFPSLLGPENLPPAEGLAFGCQVLVADVEGAREVYAQNVKYFNPLDATDIAKVMLSILDQPVENFEITNDTSKLTTFCSAQDYLAKILDIIKFLSAELDLNLVKSN
jgi:glycosyltransferase involved in cell wall biosynthesis